MLPSIAFKTVDGLEEMNRRTNKKKKAISAKIADDRRYEGKSATDTWVREINR